MQDAGCESMERVVPQNIATAHLMQFGQTSCIVTQCLSVINNTLCDII